MKKLIPLIIIFFLVSCSATKPQQNGQQGKAQLLNEQTFLLTEISIDKNYGLSQKKPVKVGGIDENEGPLNERRFLNALAGPNGEKISYFRAGSCCAFKTKKGFMGQGLLDNYRVTWEGSKDTVSIYINMYDYAELKAPYGFTLKK